MKIDGNEKEKAAMQAFSSGNRELGNALQDEFVAEFCRMQKTTDTCPCTAKCKYHGRCSECVAIHRAHGEHLPFCFHNIINRHLAQLSMLSEHSLIDFLDDKNK